MTSTAHALLGNNFGNVFNGAFRRMDIAEDEIRAAQRAHPKHRAAINDAFKIMCPSEGLRNKSDDLYRHHVRELLDRVVRGEDTRLATRAEVLAFYVELSLKAPLNRAGQAVYEHLFVELMGIVKVRELGLDEYVSRVMYSERDDIAECQRKLADPSRVL